MSRELLSSGKSKRVFLFNFEADNQLLSLMNMHRRGLFTRGSTTKTWDLILSQFNETQNAGLVQPRTINNRFRALQNDLKARYKTELQHIVLNENEKLVKSMMDYIESRQAAQAETSLVKRQKTAPKTDSEEATTFSEAATTFDEGFGAASTPHKAAEGPLASPKASHQDILQPNIVSNNSMFSQGTAQTRLSLQKDPAPSGLLLPSQRNQPSEDSLHIRWSTSLLDCKCSNSSKKAPQETNLASKLVVLQNQHTQHLNDAKNMVGNYKEHLNSALERVFQTLEKVALESATRACLLQGIARDGSAFLEEQVLALGCLSGKLVWEGFNVLELLSHNHPLG